MEICSKGLRIDNHKTDLIDFFFFEKDKIISGDT